MRKYLSLLLLLLLPLSLWGSNSAPKDTLSSRILFHVGSSKVDASYQDNGAVMKAFIDGVNGLMKDPDIIVHAVVVETGASPEGGVQYNDRLALERARSIRAWILSNIPLNASQVKAYSVGADWEGLWHSVWNSSCPWRTEVLDIITETGVRTDPSDEQKVECQKRLKALDGGKAWAWMLENLFPDLRAGAGTLRCVVSQQASSQKDTVVVIHEYEGPDAEWYLAAAATRATDASVRNMKEYLRKKPKGYRRDSLWRDPVVAVRTNLLMPAMNVGVEVPIGNRWSVAADWYSPWLWRQWGNRIYTPQKYCFEGLGGFVEGRYWFGNNHLSYDSCRKYRLSGHSLGLIVGAGYYDYQWDWIGRQGEYFTIGVGYMYALPLGKRGGIRLEFEVAAGYMNTGWRGYGVHETGGKLIGNYEDASWQGVVPMKAGVNLVVPIFMKEDR